MDYMGRIQLAYYYVNTNMVQDEFSIQPIEEALLLSSFPRESEIGWHKEGAKCFCFSTK